MNPWFLTCLICIRRICLRQPKPKIFNSRRLRLSKILMQQGNRGTLDWSQIILNHHRRLSTRNKIKSVETQILVHSTITLKCRICLWAKEGIGTRSRMKTVHQLTVQVQFYNKNLKVIMVCHLRSHQKTHQVWIRRIGGNRSEYRLQIWKEIKVLGLNLWHSVSLTSSRIRWTYQRIKGQHQISLTINLCIVNSM